MLGKWDARRKAQDADRFADGICVHSSRKYGFSYSVMISRFWLTKLQLVDQVVFKVSIGKSYFIVGLIVFGIRPLGKFNYILTNLVPLSGSRRKYWPLWPMLSARSALFFYCITKLNLPINKNE